MGYWPAGLCLCFPKPGTVNGRVVLAPGDVNLTFKRYLEAPVRLTIENDYVTRIEGDGPRCRAAALLLRVPGATARPMPRRMSAGA